MESKWISVEERMPEHGSASRLKWCPFCGAMMDGGKDDENA